MARDTPRLRALHTLLVHVKGIDKKKNLDSPGVEEKLRDLVLEARLPPSVPISVEGVQKEIAREEEKEDKLEATNELIMQAGLDRKAENLGKNDLVPQAASAEVQLDQSAKALDMLKNLTPENPPLARKKKSSLGKLGG